MDEESILSCSPIANVVQVNSSDTFHDDSHIMDGQSDSTIVVVSANENESVTGDNLKY